MAGDGQHKPGGQSSGAILSTKALASIAGEQTSPPTLPVCSGERTPYPAGPSDAPAKGLYTWATVAKFTERQEEYLTGYSQYKHDGSVYSVGFLKDYSVDSTVGLSADFLDSEVKSRQNHDTRTSDVEAYIANAHYHTTLWWKYPVEGKLFYGRAKTNGKGEFGTPFRNPWDEEKHTSTLYGASLRFKFPMIFGNDIKMVMESGFDYARLKSESYDVRLMSSPNPLTMPRRDSKSLQIPLIVTVKRDFEKNWGSIAPRLRLGFARELNKSALGVRSFHASAAATVITDPVTMQPAALIADNTQEDFMQFGIGVDLLTRNGWDVRADYIGTWTDSYRRSEFKLEVGKCF